MNRGTSLLATIILLIAPSGCGDPCLDDGFGGGKCLDTTSGASSTSDSSDSGADGMDTSSASSGDGDSATTGDGDGTTGDGTTGDGDGTTGDGTTGDGDGTTGDGTTGDGTTGDGDGTTGDGDGTCAGSMDFQIDAGDATLQGWGVEVSLADMGDYIFPTSMNGTATFEIDVPCDDTWWVWVLGWDQVDADSFEAQVDGQPGGGEVFDLDCTATPSGEGIYRWARLNARSTTGACDTSGPNDWASTWSAGLHTVTFLPRESDALSRIWVTNDPAFVPS